MAKDTNESSGRTRAPRPASLVVRVSPRDFKAMTSSKPSSASAAFVKAYRESAERGQ